MMSEQKDLQGVQETLLLPLWGRAIESKKNQALLVDNVANKIIENINYDFTKIEKKVNKLSCASWISRSIYFDSKISDFLKIYPEGTIINIGCGLDTTYDRVNNGKATWYELDFPEVINIRRQFIKESENRIFLPYSVFDKEWYSRIKNRKEVFIMLAGVIYYFNEKQVKELFDDISNQFEYVDMVFDYSSPIGVKIANKKVIKDGGMDKSAYLKWGVKDIKIIKKWNIKIKIIDNIKMFYDHKKRYPLKKRIGMIISDLLSIMSLAHIRIG